MSRDGDAVAAPVDRPAFSVVCDEDDAVSRGECDLVRCEMEEDRLECFHDEGQVSMFS